MRVTGVVCVPVRCGQSAIRSLLAAWQSCRLLDDGSIVNKVVLPVFGHVSSDLDREVRSVGLEVLGSIIQEVRRDHHRSAVVIV